MWMTDYMSAVRRGLRDKYGFTPRPGSSEKQPVFDTVPDGTYPLTINGKMDHVRIVDGKISCCNFGTDLDEVARVAQALIALLDDRHPGLASWNEMLGRQLETLHRLTATAPQYVFYVCIHRYGWRSGKPLEVLGMQMVKPQGAESRACFHLRDPEDGAEDYAPMSDVMNYRLISADDVAQGRIPPVTR